jgi:plastocyanin
VDRQGVVERYLDGQMSRRVFLRRMVAAGVTVGAAAAYADLLLADPAQAAPFYDYYIQIADFSYTPADLKSAALGKTVEWAWFSPVSHHSATDPTRVIDSGFKSPYSAYDLTIPFSGTYSYVCKETTHVPMSGKVHVPMAVGPKSARLGTAFELNWSLVSPLTAPYVEDIQRRRPSDNGFKNWITGTTNRGTAYTPTARGLYKFRARVRNTSNHKASGWSPVASFKVT